MALPTGLVDLVIALALGMLVGLQRQWSHDDSWGIRTFALASLLGATAALLTDSVGGWLIPAGLIAIASLTIVANMVEQEPAPPGQTTEVAVLLMYLVGAYVVLGNRTLAVVIGATVAVLLHLKDPLKVIVGRIEDDDLKAFLQFVVISLIVLPVLPNQAFGPYQVLNPRQIWWMVVLIVGLNLLGYAGHRLLGRRRGTALAGVLGGLISSTATTAAYARAPESDPLATRAASAVILLAAAIVFVRVIVEIGVVSRDFLPTAAPPILVLLVVAATLGIMGLRGAAKGPDETPGRRNPSHLGPAFFFALIYAIVIFAVAAAEDRLGGAGLYGVAALSGLTDMDAITLSTAELVDNGRLSADAGWRAIVIAAMSNLVFKGGIVVAAGNRALRRRIGFSFGVLLVLSAVLLIAWPG